MIEQLTARLAPELEQVDRHIQSILDSDTALVREVGEYVRASQGKRLRPILVILAAQAFGYQGEDHTKIAAALELVHTATLLHDDVIDKAPLRRALPTVNARYGDDVAILIGDFLYANSFHLALNCLSPKILSIITQVTARMCEGEMFQIEKRDELLTTEDYLRIVRNKTAYLFSACAGLGSHLASASEADAIRLGNFGLNFGIAFQITDDTLDLTAGDDDLGKQHWADIRNGKQTLPLIHTLAAATPDDREALLHCWNNGRDSQTILAHIRKYRGVEHALEAAQSYSEAAQAELSPLAAPNPGALQSLRDLAAFIVHRHA